MSMIAVVNTLLVNIRQGSRELSMLRAVGLDRGGARRLVLTEAVVLAASGAVLGVATGCAVVVGMLRAVSTPGFTPSFAFPLTAAIAVVERRDRRQRHRHPRARDPRGPDQHRGGDPPRLS